MKICYVPRKFSGETLMLIDTCNEVIRDYDAQGYTLTLRQLYYQLVSRDIIVNEERSYKRLGSIVNDARLAGLIDWNAIEDRGRNLRQNAHWSSPIDIIRAARYSFKLDRWQNQAYRPECFPPETPVSTTNGYTSIGDIGIGDYVLADNGDYHKVKKVFRNPYRGDMIRIKAKGLLAVMCTPEHPVYAIQHDKSFKSKGVEKHFKEAAFCKANTIDNQDMLAVPRMKLVRDIEKVEMIGGKRSFVIGEVPLDYSLCALIGIYLAEGCIKKDGIAQFTIHVDEVDQYDAIKRWGDSIGLSNQVYIDGGAMQVHLCSKALCDFLRDNFGNGAFEKRLPGWFMLLPFDKQMMTLKHYYMGDGAKDMDESRSALVVSTRSPILAGQVHSVLIRLGYGATIHTMQDHDLPRYAVGVSGGYGQELADAWGIPLPEVTRRYNHIKMDDRFAYYPVDSVLCQSYSGEVVNLEVEDRHTYCVPFVVHNCWVEKEALVGVVARICETLDVPFFACKGYNSQSEQWRAGRRLQQHCERGQTPIIFHLGDHDPSGIDMTRDNSDRLAMFMGGVEVRRLALNMDQVRQYNPPPNPAKLEDSRIAGYVELYGNSSWELDALEPQVLSDLIEDAILSVRDEDAYEEVVMREEGYIESLRNVEDNWSSVVRFLDREN